MIWACCCRRCLLPLGADFALVGASLALVAAGLMPLIADLVLRVLVFFSLWSWRSWLLVWCSWALVLPFWLSV